MGQLEDPVIPQYMYILCNPSLLSSEVLLSVVVAVVGSEVGSEELPEVHDGLQPGAALRLVNALPEEALHLRGLVVVLDGVQEAALVAEVLALGAVHAHVAQDVSGIKEGKAGQ